MGLPTVDLWRVTCLQGQFNGDLTAQKVHIPRRGVLASWGGTADLGIHLGTPLFVCFFVPSLGMVLPSGIGTVE